MVTLLKKSPDMDDGMFDESKYRRFVSSEMRSDGGPGFWLCSNRPFSEVAADLFIDACRCNKPVPSVLGRRALHTPATAKT